MKADPFELIAQQLAVALTRDIRRFAKRAAQQALQQTLQNLPAQAGARRRRHA